LLQVLVICRERMARMMQRLPTDAELAGALSDCMLLPTYPSSEASLHCNRPLLL